MSPGYIGTLLSCALFTNFSFRYGTTPRTAVRLQTEKIQADKERLVELYHHGYSLREVAQEVG